MKRNFYFIVILFLFSILSASCGGGNGQADTESPSVPGDLRVAGVSSTKIEVSWDVSVDNFGVAGYKIYRNGAYLQSAGTLSVLDEGLSPNMQYCYQVSAFDTVGNESGMSNETCTMTQSPWIRQLASSSNDYAYGVAVDTRGNVYIGGYSGGSVDGNPNEGAGDILLAKYDAWGNKQWTLQFGTAENELGYGVATDSRDNVYVVGDTDSDLHGIGNAGGTDAFLVKFDSSGKKQWTRLLGTGSTEHAAAVVVDGQDNIYMVGYTNGDLEGNINAGWRDGFLAKYDSLGNKLWVRLFGGPCFEWFQSVAVDNNENVYVTGNSDYLGDECGYTGPLEENSLVKYDSSGNRLKRVDVGADPLGVAVDRGGGIYVTGLTYFDMDGIKNEGPPDIFLRKYDSSLIPQWTRLLGTQEEGAPLDPGYDEAHGLAVDSNGDAYLIGISNGNLDGNISSGGFDIALIKYDSLGNQQWTRLVGSSEDDYGERVIIDRWGNVYAVGYSWGDLGGYTNQGASDIFLLKFDSSGLKP